MLKRALLSRKSILFQVILLLAVVVVAYVFPQRFTTNRADFAVWQKAWPFWAKVQQSFGLDHVYTTPWFALLLFTALLSLSLSAFEQLRGAVSRTFAPPADPSGALFDAEVSKEKLQSVLQQAGFLPLGRAEGCARFVRHPWGYWGNFFLHAGIIITLAASLLIVLTEKRGVINLLEGELFRPGDRWTNAESGLAATPLELPFAVRLDRFRADYWETDNIKQLTTDVTFASPQETVSSTLSINHTLTRQGVRIYQGKNFGDSFHLELTDNAGAWHGIVLEIPHPLRRDRASYGAFTFEGIPYEIQAKYFADAEKRGMESGNPLLVLRLLEGRKVVGELPLQRGASGTLGPYAARLVRTAPWGSIIFVSQSGMWGIFLGFFIVILGGTLHYFTPPREVSVWWREGVALLSWRASRFERLYGDEFGRILERLEVQKG